MSRRLEPGPALANANLTSKQIAALREWEQATAMLRRLLDAYGQSREISLAHSSLDVVSFWGALHISMPDRLGTTPAQRQHLNQGS